MKIFNFTERKFYLLYAIFLLALLAACNPQDTSTAPERLPREDNSASTNTPAAVTATSAPVPTAPPLEISSSGFAQGEVIPDRYACTGENLSPELSWGEPPADTQSLALIFDDPDAPGGSWVHWVVFNMPADQQTLPEGVAPLAEHPDGSISGSNSWGELGYGGPCPPQGSTHQYIFALYALDTELSLGVGASKQELLAAMQGHILAETEISGLFSR